MATGQPQISLLPFNGSGLGQQSLGLGQQSLVTLGQQQLTSLGQQTLAGLGQQPMPGLSQPQLASIGQGPLVQMQPSLLPNFFIPPLNLGASQFFSKHLLEFFICNLFICELINKLKFIGWLYVNFRFSYTC